MSALTPEYIQSTLIADLRQHLTLAEDDLKFALLRQQPELAAQARALIQDLQAELDRRPSWPNSPTPDFDTDSVSF